MRKLFKKNTFLKLKEAGACKRVALEKKVGPEPELQNNCSDPIPKPEKKPNVSTVRIKMDHEL